MTRQSREDATGDMDMPESEHVPTEQDLNNIPAPTRASHEQQHDILLEAGRVLRTRKPVLLLLQG